MNKGVKIYETGVFRNWKECKITLSYYENGTVKGSLYSSDRLLSTFSQEGDNVQEGTILYVKKSAIQQYILGRLLENNAIYGYVMSDDCAVCAVNTKAVFGQEPAAPAQTHVYTELKQCVAC